jgi:hypothetical protein
VSCERCGNRALMWIKCYDEECCVALLRCLICGDRMDAIIRYHRALPSPPPPVPAVVFPVYHPKSSRCRHRTVYETK